MPGALTWDPDRPGGAQTTWRGQENPDAEPPGAVSGGGIVGTFADTTALQAAFPAGTQGRRAMVGASAPYTEYTDNGADWVAGGGGGSGTVTSVAASVPSFLSISGSPITGAGTLVIAYSGTALPVANGGTGRTTLPGSTTQILFNDAGAYAAAAGLAWDKTTNTLTISSGTRTANAPVQSLSQTWNSSGVTFTGWRLNITDTASAAASLLMDLQVGGASRFQVAKNGDTTLPSYSTLSIPLGTISTGAFVTTNSSFDVLYGIPIGLAGSGGTANVFLRASAANTIAQYNGTSAQEHQWFGTRTDATNYRRVVIGMSTAGVGYLRPEGAGTGASGNVLHISGLPTSNPGPGILWNDAGTVKVGT